jgi:hypothetical protein
VFRISVRNHVILDLACSARNKCRDLGNCVLERNLTHSANEMFLLVRVMGEGR